MKLCKNKFANECSFQIQESPYKEMSVSPAYRK